MLILVFLLLLATPAFAIDPTIMSSIERYCQTTNDPQHCLASFLHDAVTFNPKAQPELHAPMIWPMMLPSLTLPPLPYVDLVAPSVTPAFRPSVACQTMPLGSQAYTSCY